MMQITSWRDFMGTRIALLGSGLENTSLIPHLLSHGANVTICELNTKRALTLQKTFPKILLSTGSSYLDNLDRFDIIFRSPGFPVAVVEKALKSSSAKPHLSSATDLFLSLTKSRVIGVTGSKGKGTTSTMIGSILAAAGKKVVVAGNIGRPIFDIINDLTKDTIIVLEMSSFQLEDLQNLPEIAVVLAISENEHLQPLSAESPNFHLTVNDYVAAKAHITLFQSAQDNMIYVADNDLTVSIAAVTKARKTSLSQLSLEADYYVGEDGVVWSQGRELINLTEIGLRGQHIFLNATAAIAVSRLFNCRKMDLIQGIANWRPLPHRLEQFADIKGVTFVDDSYATSPEAAIAAIESFDQPIIWLSGGSTKGASFDTLARSVSRSTVKLAILIGQEAEKLAESLSQFAQKIAIKTPKTFTQAVKLAVASAQPGDVVLLSPACASKDMFKNAAERGERFKSLVNQNPKHNDNRDAKH